MHTDTAHSCCSHAESGIKQEKKMEGGSKCRFTIMSQRLLDSKDRSK